MGVRILFGSPPALPPVLSAEVLRGLRAPDGSRPCRGGLHKALRWIGDREIPIEQALEEAEGVLSSGDLEWGRGSLGISGYGSGDYGCGYEEGGGEGSVFGHGYDKGKGKGNGYGYGYDLGSGHGFGYSYGYAAIHGHGYGSGEGEGNGYGSDLDSGSGYGLGAGYGFGDSDGDGKGEEI